jgi:polyphosphate kinase
VSPTTRGTEADSSRGDVLRLFRCDVPSAARLRALVGSPLPASPGAAWRQLHRDLYLDTADDALRARGVVCRLRLLSDDRQLLSLHVVGAHGAAAQRTESRVHATEPRAALAERTAVGRRLQALVNPAQLEVRVDLEVERWHRTVHGGLLRRPRVELHYDSITVRRGPLARTFQHLSAHLVRGPDDEMERLARAFEHEEGLRRVAADPRERAELLLKWGAPARRAMPAPGAAVRARQPVLPVVPRTASTGPVEFLNPELSLLAFQERVLAVAEDVRTPLRERLRFIAIVTSNLDEFYMVRVAGLMQAAREQTEEQSEDGLTPAARHEAIARRATALTARQGACFRACVAALAARGTRIRTWAELDARDRAELGAYFADAVLPALTPLAMTLSTGHPLPHFPHLSLSVAAVLASTDGEPPRLVEVELPAGVPRFVPIGPTSRDVLPLEELVRANLHVLYPGARIEHAHAFRVTRGGDLGIASEHSDSLLEAVADASRRRARNPVVRVEIERAMPGALRHALLESLSRECVAGDLAVADEDLQEVDGLLDLRAADTLPLTDDATLAYAPFRGAKPVASGRAIVDVVRERDLLVHHPFDRFSATVLRFLREAAADADVIAIKMTLYRVGDPSPVVAALLDAARRGANVVAFVELQARFDEDSNVRWARTLEAAGGRVVYGLPGFKNHAKMALVVRREGGLLRSYAHVGTGNYHARTSQQYTDLSLFSADEALVSDVAELFNALTGSSRPPRQLSHGALSAPHQMLPAILERIAREGAHARDGREARITFKVNGLSDAEVIRALYRAARDGVAVDLLVRGVCTLRPGVSGLSTGIRVLSVVGRFLEHSRVYRFANGGEPEYFVGSADLRPRNLRQRVELLVPVRDAACRATLDHVLALYVDDPSAWELAASGEYEPRARPGPSTQEVLMRESRGVRDPAPARA